MRWRRQQRWPPLTLYRFSAGATDRVVHCYQGSVLCSESAEMGISNIAHYTYFGLVDSLPGFILSTQSRPSSTLASLPGTEVTVAPPGITHQYLFIHPDLETAEWDSTIVAANTIITIVVRSMCNSRPPLTNLALLLLVVGRVSAPAQPARGWPPRGGCGSS